jgi:hypothetical protein
LLKRYDSRVRSTHDESRFVSLDAAGDAVHVEEVEAVVDEAVGKLKRIFASV